MPNPLKTASIRFIAFWAIVNLFFFLIFQFNSCAIVKAPTGGNKDTIPPIALGSIPKNYTKNFVGDRVTILFNEFIKIKDQNSSVQVSPEPEKTASIKVVKKSIEIRFKSPLEKNRTYAINFGNSIIDYNEGNTLDNYRYVLSTGPYIDSLKISGTVSDALDTAIKKDVYVIIQPANSDTAIYKSKPFLFTTTDKEGTFTLENLPSGNFNIYALEESNKNKRFDSKAEHIAFINNVIHLKKDTSGINLHLFLENDTSLKVLKKNLKDGLLKVLFTQPSDSLEFTPKPEMKSKEYIIENHGRGDTVFVWLPDPNQDSVVLLIKRKNHNPIELVQQNFNKPKKITPFTTEDNIKQDILTPNIPLEITFSRPVSKLDFNKIQIVEDSLKYNADSIIQSDLSSRRYRIYYAWVTGKRYNLQLEKNTLTDIYGGKNQGYDHGFNLGEDKNYGIINLKITVPIKGNYLIELLDESFQPLQKKVVTSDATLPYKYIIPGKYRFRITYDTNKNGRYDTGDLSKKIQPERIVNSKEITVRANFEINPSFPIPK